MSRIIVRLLGRSAPTSGTFVMTTGGRWTLVPMEDWERELLAV